MGVPLSLWNPVSITLVVISLCTVWILARRNTFNKLRLPPGPRGWPIIGNLPILLRHPGYCNDDFVFSKFTRKYGDIFRLQFGFQQIYVLSNIDHVRKVFTHNKVAARPHTVAKEIVFGNNAQGIVFASGPTWTAVARFTKNLFRDLGIGRGTFETTVESEIKRLIARLDDAVEAPVPCSDLSDLFFSAIGSMACSTVYGGQYEYGDLEFKKILTLLRTWVESNSYGGLLQTNRLLCQLPFGPAKGGMDCLAEFKTFFEGKIHESKSMEIESTRSSKNFMGGYLAEIARGERYFNESNLLACCVEMLVAGTFSTKATLSFALLYLTSHQEVQSKCQVELDRFVEDHGMPSYSDRSKLPYIQATILETMRHATPAPVGVPRLVEEDLDLFGYDFPKGTLVFANILNINMNPAKFQDSADFRPERFMENGEFILDTDIIPFSMGRRVCIGESLARMNVFLFMTALLRRYTFTPPKGVEMPDYRLAETGSDRSPPPYSVSVTKRQN